MKVLRKYSLHRHRAAPVLDAGTVNLSRGILYGMLVSLGLWIAIVMLALRL